MQYRSPVGGGPSGNTCPWWLSQRAQRVSVRIMPWLVSVWSDTTSGRTGWVKLGHPDPDSYLSPQFNSPIPQTEPRNHASLMQP